MKIVDINTEIVEYFEKAVKIKITTELVNDKGETIKQVEFKLLDYNAPTDWV